MTPDRFSVKHLIIRITEIETRVELMDAGFLIPVKRLSPEFLGIFNVFSYISSSFILDQFYLNITSRTSSPGWGPAATFCGSSHGSLGQSCAPLILSG